MFVFKIWTPHLNVLTKPTHVAFGRHVALQSIADIKNYNLKTGDNLSSTIYLADEHSRKNETYSITHMDAESNTYSNVLVHLEALQVTQDSALILIHGARYTRRIT